MQNDNNIKEDLKDLKDKIARALGLSPGTRNEALALLRNLQKELHLFSGKEIQMIEGVLKMRELKARDVMIVRSEIIALNINDDFDTVVNAICEFQHSRYPVWDESNESVLGILIAKDVWQYYKKTDEFNLKDIIREAQFEPDSKSLDTLLDEFLSAHSHMFIVIDEFSMVTGIITIEDLLERIVGEIEDESDEEEDKPLIQLPQGEGLRVKGSMSIEELNVHMKTQLDNPHGADSIASLISAQFESVPTAGDTWENEDYIFTIHQVEGHKIQSIDIKTKTGRPE